MPEMHAARRGRLRTILAERDIEALLVTRLVNVRYLTGFTGSNAALLLSGDSAEVDLLATDGRYATQSAAQAPDLARVIERAVASVLAARAAKDGIRRLAFEEHDVTVVLHAALKDAMDGACRGGRMGASVVELVHAEQPVEVLRTVKDEEEIALLHRACAISDLALQELLPAIAPGRSERSIARELESRMLNHGADGPAFATIVATGPNTAVPHHRPTERTVAAGDLLKIDFGALYGGYHADCTRTFVVGAEPAGWQADVHALVREAQRAGREALAPGAAVVDVDHAARSVIEAAGHGEDFPHGLGHGVGLEIHEAPLMVSGATARLADCTPVTVEPGVYLEGRGGVRIEDTLVVRAAADGTAGAPELLTHTTKELLVLR